MMLHGVSLSRALRGLVFFAGALLAVPSLTLAAEDHSGHAMPSAIKRAEVALVMPELAVRRQDGKAQTLRQALDDGRPVMLNFIFTTCTAICPVTSQVFTEVREGLGPQRDAVHVVSVSIDPEFDTPARMSDYAKRFSPGGAWSFYTSNVKDSVAIQKAFNAYQGDKMNHLPITFLRAAPGAPWVRYDGFAAPSTLLAEVRKMLTAGSGKAAPNASSRGTGVQRSAAPRQ